MALIRRQATGSDMPPASDGARAPGARVLAAGAKSAERVARAAGVDRLLNEAAEEAIVRALESPVVIRAIERVIESDALAAELKADEIRQIVKRALDSDAAEAAALGLAAHRLEYLISRRRSTLETNPALAARA